jgi:hypothetical protein
MDESGLDESGPDESGPDESGPDESGLDEGGLREQIQKLENRIEQLAEAIEGCRKLVLLSKIAIAVGGIVAVAMALGLIWFDPAFMIGAITAVIGGAVLLGSNSSTWDEKAAALQAAEAERAALISEIAPRLVGNGNGRSLPRPN